MTEFRRKWEDFFANDQQLRSEPSAEALLTDLAVREIAMADYKVRASVGDRERLHTACWLEQRSSRLTHPPIMQPVGTTWQVEEVPMLDELMLAEQAVEAKAKKEVEKAKEVARVAELTAMTENAGGKTLALILAEPDKIARGEEAVSMETAMAMNVGRYVNKRKTRAPKRMKEGNSDENNGLLQVRLHRAYQALELAPTSLCCTRCGGRRRWLSSGTSEASSTTSTCDWQSAARGLGVVLHCEPHCSVSPGVGCHVASTGWLGGTRTLTR